MAITINPSTAERKSACPQWASAPPSESAMRARTIKEEISRRLLCGKPDEGLPDDVTAAVDYAMEEVETGIRPILPMASLLIRPTVRCHGIDGKADLVLIDGDRAVIVQLITGYDDMHEETTLQAELLAIALARNHSLDRVQWCPVYVDRGERRLHECEMVQSLVEGAQELINRRRNIQTGAQCKTCRHASSCPALMRVIDDLPTEMPVDDMHWQDIDATLEQAKLVEAWIKSVKRRAFELASANALPGYTIASGRPTRAWVDEDLARSTLEELARRKGVEDFDPYDKKLKSPAAAEKVLGKSKPVREAMAACVRMVPGRPTLRKEGET